MKVYIHFSPFFYNSFLFQKQLGDRKMSAGYKDDQNDWQTVCLKYLLFMFNFLFWVSDIGRYPAFVW